MSEKELKEAIKMAVDVAIDKERRRIADALIRKSILLRNEQDAGVMSHDSFNRAEGGLSALRFALGVVQGDDR
jgi:hypothetical protein